MTREECSTKYFSFIKKMLLFGVLLAIVSFLVFGIWLKWDLIFNIGFYAGMFFSWYFFIKAIIVVTKYKLQK